MAQITFVAAKHGLFPAWGSEKNNGKTNEEEEFANAKEQERGAFKRKQMQEKTPVSSGLLIEERGEVCKMFGEYKYKVVWFQYEQMSDSRNETAHAASKRIKRASKAEPSDLRKLIMSNYFTC